MDQFRSKKGVEWVQQKCKEWADLKREENKKGIYTDRFNRFSEMFNDTPMFKGDFNISRGGDKR